MHLKKVLWPFLQQVNSVVKRMVYIALYTSLRWCKKGEKYITEFLSFLVLKKAKHIGSYHVQSAGFNKTWCITLI